LNFWDFYNSQNSKSKLGQIGKANKVLLLLNCFSTVKFLKLKCFYIEKYYEKKNLKINLSQFGVWEDLQMIYLLFIFNFLLFIEFWALTVGPGFIFLFIFNCWAQIEIGPASFHH
jgi:hypothetical protein